MSSSDEEDVKQSQKIGSLAREFARIDRRRRDTIPATIHLLMNRRTIHQQIDKLSIDKDAALAEHRYAFNDIVEMLDKDDA